MNMNPGYFEGEYTLPPLPYAYDALEPLLDAETLKLHHDKHHAAYVAGANAACKALREIAEGKKDASLAPLYVRQLAFNEAGNVLHTIYWTNMSPDPQSSPQGDLAKAIQQKFGSFDGMMMLFRATSQSIQGSGWGALALEPVSRELVVVGYEKHENGVIPGAIPLLVCDVWEHAYYLKHQNNRAGYIDDFIRLIDWKNVEERFEKGMEAIQTIDMQ